jgi:hypothetical protein
MSYTPVQANITCRLLSLYLDGDTAIAEWEAEFDDLVQGVRKRMREIALLVFEDRLHRLRQIASFLGETGKDLAAEIMAKVIMRQTGMG